MSHAAPRPATFRDVTPAQWKTLIAAMAGWMFDSMDFMIYVMAIGRLQKYFGFDAAQAGLLATVVWPFASLQYLQADNVAIAPAFRSMNANAEDLMSSLTPAAITVSPTHDAAMPPALATFLSGASRTEKPHQVRAYRAGIAWSMSLPNQAG